MTDAWSDFPYSADDLREIADAIDRWSGLLFDGEGGFTETSQLVDTVILHRPEILEAVAGRLVFVDASWIGFKFEGQK